jgi:predicted HTH domain antitoxin
LKISFVVIGVRREQGRNAMDSQEQEARRMIAAELFEQGELSDRQIADLLEVTTRHRRSPEAVAGTQNVLMIE